MRPLPIVAALLFALPAAALAQSGDLVNATPGALAGRSPHQSFRPAAAVNGCPATMHSLPAGKLPVYRSAMLPRPGCEGAVRVVDAGASSVRAAR